MADSNKNQIRIERKAYLFSPRQIGWIVLSLASLFTFFFITVGLFSDNSSMEIRVKNVLLLSACSAIVVFIFSSFMFIVKTITNANRNSLKPKHLAHFKVKEKFYNSPELVHGAIDTLSYRKNFTFKYWITDSSGDLFLLSREQYLAIDDGDNVQVQYTIYKRIKYVVVLTISNKKLSDEDNMIRESELRLTENKEIKTRYAKGVIYGIIWAFTILIFCWTLCFIVYYLLNSEFTSFNSTT